MTSLSLGAGTTAEFEGDLRMWGSYPPAMAFYKSLEVGSRLNFHRSNLNRALHIIGPTRAFKDVEWDLCFSAARSNEQIPIQRMIEQRVDLHQEMDQMKQLLARLFETKSRGNFDHKAERTREDVIERLRQLRSDGADSECLTSSDLMYEVQKSSQRPFHSGSMNELSQSIWLDKYEVVLKVFWGKQFDKQPTKEARARIDHQADLWRTLRHPNVLQLHGIVTLNEGETEGTPIGSVCPWMPNREVMGYLRTHPDADRLKFIHDTAKGLQYLHSIGILHDALQGSNVLVDDSGSAMLTDFSLTKFMDPSMVMTRTGLGPSLRWWAPETINERILSTHADVYSWAMTALEIISGLEPYYTITSIRQFMQTINQHLPPKREEYVAASTLLSDDRIWNLMLSCWGADPARRPTMDQVARKVKEIRSGSTVTPCDGSRSGPRSPATGTQLADMGSIQHQGSM
ncbi:hypothetical protein FRB97_008573 [Tulasnella sp. 331]|nr:hypothetical protein FRB97_008573 [Tulasnella sp. 331]